MVPIPCLEVVRCEADVCFCCVFGCDRGLVHDFIHHTFTIQWATLTFFLQLHFLPSSRCSVVASAFFRMALLWPSMICLTLGMQL